MLCVARQPRDGPPSPSCAGRATRDAAVGRSRAGPSSPRRRPGQLRAACLHARRHCYNGME